MVLFFLLWGGIFAQDIPLPGAQPGNQPPVSTSLIQEIGVQDFTSLLKSGNLTRPVDPAFYQVDAGDQFIIKVDPRGPAVKIYMAMVTGEGYVLLPEAPSVYVKHLPLNRARQRIIQSLKSQMPHATIEVFLFQIHPITISFASPLNGVGEGQFLSNTRLNSAVEYFVQSWWKNHVQLTNVQAVQSPSQTDEGKYFQTKPLDSLKATASVQPALRRIGIIRDGKTYRFDLLKFRYLGQENHNPYLLDNDVVIIPAFDPRFGTITVKGAVGKTSQFEFHPGDRLAEALAFSGGLTRGADSTHIQLYRYRTSQAQPQIVQLRWPADSAFFLMADDVILVHPKPLSITRGKVTLVGEVKYPGEYPIADNTITLRQLIEQAGGFTPRASLEDARIYRSKFYKGEENLAIFLRLRPQDLDVNIISYLGVRSREEVRIVACDFQKLFMEGDTTQNIPLRDGDIVYIPQPIGIVYVSGAVKQPGTYPYRKGWHYEDYIAAAGGYTNLARKGAVRIIRGDTGVWYKKDKHYTIRAGDMIFVPEKTEIRWQTFMKDVAITLGQLATVALIMTRIFGGN